MSGQKQFTNSNSRPYTRGLATSVSTLIIFFSLTVTSTVAYYYAMSRLDTDQRDLKLVAVEDKMIDLATAISSIAWSAGSSRTIFFSDYGGKMRVEPTQNNLSIVIETEGFSQTIFNGSTGRIAYQLQASDYLDDWLLGDRRPLVNSSSAYQAQVRFELGPEGRDLIAGFRPHVSFSLGNIVDDRRLNNIRIYIINLNGSEALLRAGELHLAASCREISSQIYSFSLNASEFSINVTASLNGLNRTLAIPISSGSSGSTVRVEIVASDVEVEQVSA